MRKRPWHSPLKQYITENKLGSKISPEGSTRKKENIAENQHGTKKKEKRMMRDTSPAANL